MTETWLPQTITDLTYIMMFCVLALAAVIGRMKRQVASHLSGPLPGSGMFMFRLMAQHKVYYPFSRLRMATVVVILLSACTFFGDKILIHKQQQQTLATLQQLRLKYR